MKKVILLIGPTGVGKTVVSILLAEALHSEIISADSMQIYRHMDIGTAKPSVDQQRRIRHHMIGAVDPWESYSTGQYIAAAALLIGNLLKTGKTPVIAGGTGLYIKAMTRGIFTASSADWKLRNELLSREETQPGSLYASLKGLDADAAARIMPADTRRIVRALEVCMKSEKKLSELQETLTRPLPYEFVKIGITRDRKELYSLIDERVDLMMERGLPDEVARVVKMIEDAETRRCGDAEMPAGGSDSALSCPLPVSSFTSMQAIGYKEIAMHLDGRISLTDAVGLIKQRSRNYAKRQFTWFKKEDGIQWVDATGMHDAEEIFRKVIQFIN